MKSFSRAITSSVVIAASIPPCSAEPCPIYDTSGQLIDQAIEMRSGRAAEIGLRVGDRVNIKPLAVAR